MRTRTAVALVISASLLVALPSAVVARALLGLAAAVGELVRRSRAMT